MPPHRRATFGQDVVNDLRKMLREAPEPPDDKPAEYSKLGLIRDLAPELRALARRGWSWKALAAMVSQRVAISPDLLQSYVRGRSRVSRKGKGEMGAAPTKRDPPRAPKSGPPIRTSPTRRAPSAPSTPADDAATEELLAEDAWFTDNDPATGPVGAR
jgi:hypothetical protein